MKKISDRTRPRAVGLLMLLIAAVAQAQSNPFAKGPDPTSASLNATSGPFAVVRVEVPDASTRGFGAATIYYPNPAGSYAGFAMAPGFIATRSSVAWLAQRIASHGFVVIAINTNSIFDQPPSRAIQLAAALRYLTTASPAAARTRVDAARLGVAGHSMGGGGSLIAARDNPALKAVVPLTPWNLNTDFSTMRVPTLIVGAENDTVAPVAFHAIPFYVSLPDTIAKAYAELNGGTHFSPSSLNTPIGRYAVAWVKRFMDADTRYSPFLCGAPHDEFATPTVFSDYRDNCPVL